MPRRCDSRLRPQERLVSSDLRRAQRGCGVGAKTQEESQ